MNWNRNTVYGVLSAFIIILSLYPYWPRLKQAFETTPAPITLVQDQAASPSPHPPSSANSPVLPAPTLQAGFSPEGSAEALVLSVINNAQSSLRIMAYSFTAPNITTALINAKACGVDVRMVVDEKGNRDRYSTKALTALKEAGILIRTDSDFAIQHDKVIIADEETVETTPSTTHSLPKGVTARTPSSSPIPHNSQKTTSLTGKIDGIGGKLLMRILHQQII
ncbi:phospholipase D-like domain-containing protein [Entomobacter blattae]|uniref:phospholipase D n=1 Tax=Entomobacter blattae TaxID=2762277 RepID=A0A7H1NRN9_9PROT|nr:phospholipase D-like domain-containing protein [Entomobacter blattae]QNT78449.1 PLD-like domain protein [Entomobacter blattae]QNT78648.1 PLD-like domain protein [Entomobacter blattae]QNT78813.1 PLD-like domain protein [Entomobacter blattae]